MYDPRALRIPSSPVLLEVDADFSTYTGDANRLRLVRDDWAEHAVGIVLDGTELRTSVIRSVATLPTERKTTILRSTKSAMSSSR